MRLCVKIGGALIERTEGRAALADTLATARHAGHELCVVHGGGKQIAELATRLGLAERRHEGLRITDAETARVVTWVLAGEVNKMLVAALGRAGVPAIGLTGADLALFAARRKRVAGVDLGYVGELKTSDVHAAALEPLLAQRIVPVIATIGPERDAEPGAPFLNINADEAAGPIAAACGAAELVVLSDVRGVLDANRERIPALDAATAHRLIAEGVIRDGMIPKVRAALDALDAGVRRVRILDGNQKDPLEAALLGDGTELRR